MRYSMKTVIYTKNKQKETQLPKKYKYKLALCTF